MGRAAGRGVAVHPQISAPPGNVKGICFLTISANPLCPKEELEESEENTNLLAELKISSIVCSNNIITMPIFKRVTSGKSFFLYFLAQIFILSLVFFRTKWTSQRSWWTFSRHHDATRQRSPRKLVKCYLFYQNISVGQVWMLDFTIRNVAAVVVPWQ